MMEAQVAAATRPTSGPVEIPASSTVGTSAFVPTPTPPRLENRSRLTGRTKARTLQELADHEGVLTPSTGSGESSLGSARKQEHQPEVNPKPIAHSPHDPAIEAWISSAIDTGHGNGNSNSTAHLARELLGLKQALLSQHEGSVRQAAAAREETMRAMQLKTEAQLALIQQQILALQTSQGQSQPHVGPTLPPASFAHGVSVVQDDRTDGGGSLDGHPYGSGTGGAGVPRGMTPRRRPGPAQSAPSSPFKPHAALPPHPPTSNNGNGNDTSRSTSSGRDLVPSSASRMSVGNRTSSSYTHLTRDSRATDTPELLSGIVWRGQQRGQHQQPRTLSSVAARVEAVAEVVEVMHADLEKVHAQLYGPSALAIDPDSALGRELSTMITKVGANEAECAALRAHVDGEMREMMEAVHQAQGWSKKALRVVEESDHLHLEAKIRTIVLDTKRELQKDVVALRSQVDELATRTQERTQDVAKQITEQLAQESSTWRRALADEVSLRAGLVDQIQDDIAELRIDGREAVADARRDLKAHVQEVRGELQRQHQVTTTEVAELCNNQESTHLRVNNLTSAVSAAATLTQATVDRMEREVITGLEKVTHIVNHEQGPALRSLESKVGTQEEGLSAARRHLETMTNMVTHEVTPSVRAVELVVQQHGQELGDLRKVFTGLTTEITAAGDGAEAVAREMAILRAERAEQGRQIAELMGTLAGYQERLDAQTAAHEQQARRHAEEMDKLRLDYARVQELIQTPREESRLALQTAKETSQAGLSMERRLGQVEAQLSVSTSTITGDRSGRRAGSAPRERRGGVEDRQEPRAYPGSQTRPSPALQDAIQGAADRLAVLERRVKGHDALLDGVGRASRDAVEASRAARLAGQAATRTEDQVLRLVTSTATSLAEVQSHANTLSNRVAAVEDTTRHLQDASTAEMAARDEQVSRLWRAVRANESKITEQAKKGGEKEDKGGETTPWTPSAASVASESDRSGDDAHSSEAALVIRVARAESSLTDARRRLRVLEEEMRASAEVTARMHTGLSELQADVQTVRSEDARGRGRLGAELQEALSRQQERWTTRHDQLEAQVSKVKSGLRSAREALAVTDTKCDALAQHASDKK